MFLKKKKKIYIDTSVWYSMFQIVYVQKQKVFIKTTLRDSFVLQQTDTRTYGHMDRCWFSLLMLIQYK